jgi:hypothetical protein
MQPLAQGPTNYDPSQRHAQWPQFVGPDASKYQSRAQGEHVAQSTGTAVPSGKRRQTKRIDFIIRLAPQPIEGNFIAQRWFEPLSES